MREAPRSTKQSSAGEGGGGGGCDDDEGSTTTRSPVHRRISSRYSNRLLIGLALLLVMVQLAESAVLQTTTENAPDLITDILSAAKAPEDETWRRPVNETHAPLPVAHHREYASSGYDQVKKPHEPIIDPSDKTMEDYKRFVESNCRHDDTMATFITWEQDQFAAQLKKNILSASRRDREQKASRTEKSEAERARVRALLEQEKEAVNALKSMCKTHSGLYDDGKSHEKSANDFFENEIVNSVFANMYKRGVTTYRSGGMEYRLFYADKFRPIFVTRRRNSKGDIETTVPTTHHDEHFEKEIIRTLKR